LSDFRAEVIYDLINAAEHPKRAHDMLDVLQYALAEKYQNSAGLQSMVNVGLYEALCFVRNLRMDIAREYGYMEEGK
jgi:hypothetical protein